LFFAAGWSVLGLCSNAESARQLAGKAFEIRAIDIREEFSIRPPWRYADALIHCASTRGGDLSAYRSVYLDGLLNAVTAFQPRRALFCSSTSVYTQTDGSVVTEESEAAPSRDTGLTLLDAEGVALACGGYVARLAGLYGPGRSVLQRKFLAHEATLEAGGERWINQIHRDDAARALFHLFAQRAEPGIYNVADDLPASQKEIYTWLADYYQQPLPPSSDVIKPSKRGWTNKRVSNAKMRKTGWAPIYESFRDALPQLQDT
jgi:nucleoside-diphosphate-sugar epimerase